MQLRACAFDKTTAEMSGKLVPTNSVSQTSWVAVVTQTDRPMPLRSGCVIEHLFCYFLLVRGILSYE